ncbi:MAG: AAA family ATPase [Bryobacterales bacterium]|nr:AAA family ATPase [Bryobacterales bacterium]
MSAKPAFLTRVRLENYKSIVSCDVPLGPLTFLVGPNGSGKSNFLDALRFVADSLNFTLGEAVRRRGGAEAIPYRSHRHAQAFAIRLDVELSSGYSGHYSLRLGLAGVDGVEVIHEQCRVKQNDDIHFYDTRNGELQNRSFHVGPPAQRDRLYLVPVSSLPEFRPLYDALSGMRFFQPHPAAIRDFRPPGSGRDLEADGSNLASILKRLRQTEPQAHQRLEQYFAAVLPSVEKVKTYGEGPSERLTVTLRPGGERDAVKFGPESLSDGTLRVLAILAALFHRSGNAGDRLLAFEEPEIAIHPGALAVVMSAFEEAAGQAQILVSSHSPELLDASESMDLDSVVAVGMDHGKTTLSRLSESRKQLLRDKLFSVGQLQRLGQLENLPTGVPPATVGIFEPI